MPCKIEIRDPHRDQGRKMKNFRQIDFYSVHQKCYAIKLRKKNSRVNFP
jgi:hypothetical protein